MEYSPLLLFFIKCVFFTFVFAFLFSCQSQRTLPEKKIFIPVQSVHFESFDHKQGRFVIQHAKYLDEKTLSSLVSFWVDDVITFEILVFDAPALNAQNKNIFQKGSGVSMRSPFSPLEKKEALSQNHRNEFFTCSPSEFRATVKPVNQVLTYGGVPVWSPRFEGDELLLLPKFNEKPWFFLESVVCLKIIEPFFF